MRINFRQGLISFQQDQGLPKFLRPSNVSGFVAHSVSPTPTMLAFAHGSSDYLVQIDQGTEQAWGPMTPSVTNYLFWDLDLLTGDVTRGVTLHPLIVSALEPTQLDDQHWFDLNTTTMKVWSAARNRWQTKARVFAGSVANGNTSSITHHIQGTQAALNVPGNPGFIMRDNMLQPLRKSSGELLTDDTPVYVSTTAGSSGVLVQPVNRIVPVRAGENIPAMSLVYFSDDDVVRLASSNPALMPARVPVGIVLENLTAGDVGNLSPFGEISYDQWDWSGHAGAPLYVDFTGGITLTRPAGLLTYRVGFVKNKNTVLLGVDAETYPQVYQSSATTLVISGSAPVEVDDTINGLGERTVNITVPEVGAQPGLMTPTQASALTTLGTRVTQAEADIDQLAIDKANVSHSHLIANVTGLQTALDGKADSTHTHSEYAAATHTHSEYAAVAHTHTVPEITGLQGDLNQKANRVHLNSFDEVYASVDRTGSFDSGSGTTLTLALADKAEVGHGHAIADVTDLQDELDGKASAVHGHAVADVTGLQSELDNRAFVFHTHTVANVTGLQAELDGKTDVGHAHVVADVTGLQEELDDKAAVVHGHAVADVTGLQAELDGKTDVGHAHVVADVTGLQTALDSKTDVGHAHTIANVTGLQTELDTLELDIAGKADSVHSHTIADVANLQTSLDGKAASSHTHLIANVTGLQGVLDGKAPTVHTHTIANVTGLQTELDGKALTVHGHAIADVTGLQTALDNKTDTGHAHVVADVTGLQTELDGKAAVVHGHTIADVTGLQDELDDLEAQIAGANGTPGGADTNVQFNDAGVFGGDAAFTFNKTTGLVSATSFAGDGSALTDLDAANMTTGTVDPVRLGSGTPNAATYLRGDSTWATVAATSPGGSSGQLQFNNAGAFTGAAAVTTNGTNLLIGSTTARQVANNNNGGQVFGTLQLEEATTNGNSGGVSSAVIIRNSADQTAARVALVKSYGTTVGSNVSVPSATRIGEISFEAATGGVNGIVSTATVFSSTLTNGGVTNTGGRAALFFSTMNSDMLTQAVRVSMNGNDTTSNLNFHFGSGGFSINGHSTMSASLASPTFQTISFDGSGSFIAFRASSSMGDAIQLRGSQLTLGTTTRTEAGGQNNLALLVESTVGSTRTASAAFISNSTIAADGSVFALGRTRNTLHNLHTAVQTGDTLGSIVFFGANGTNSSTRGARIDAVTIQGFTTSTSAADLSIKTTPTGSVTPTEAIAIRSTGELAITRAGAGLRFPDNSVQTTAAVSYTLPTASNTVLGGVKVGSGLAIDGSGVLSAVVTPAGNNTEVQFNNAGALGASSSFTFSAGLLTVPEISATTTFESPEVWVGDSRRHTVSGTINTTVTSPVALIDTTTFSTAKVLVTIEDGTDIHVVEFTMASIGGTAYAASSASVLSNAPLGTFSFDMSGTDMRLLFENTGPGTVNYKAVILEN